MANYLDKSAPSSPTLDRSIVMALVVCALIAAAIAYWRMGPGREITPEDFSFGPLEVDRQKLRQQREKKYAQARLQKAQAEWQQLVETARRANRSQFKGGSPVDQTKLATELKLRAQEIIPATGYEAFVIAGEPLFRECQEGLQELLGAVQRGEIELEQAVQAPPAEEYSAYRANCGDLLPVLVERGLVTRSGQWSFEEAPLIVDLLNRYRWAHIIRDQKRPEMQMTSYGYKLFARWRVEKADGYSPRQRRKFVQQLGEQYPDYDAPYALGVIAYRNGEFAEALKYFEALAENQPRSHYDSYVEYLRERVDAGASEVVADDSTP